MACADQLWRCIRYVTACAPCCPAVFVYLAELHDKKVAAGQCEAAPAATPIQQVAAGAPRAAEATSSGVGAAANGSGAHHAAGGGGMSRAQPVAMPATVELTPSRRRGKKRLVDRISKAARISTCTIS